MDNYILDSSRRIQLDGIVKQMINNKEPESNIKFVVEDFKKKYGTSNNNSTPQQQPVTPPVPQQTNESEKNAFAQQIEITPKKIENFKKNKVDNHITEFVFFLLFLFIALYFFHKRK
jgi:hypothetical protein